MGGTNFVIPSTSSGQALPTRSPHPSLRSEPALNEAEGMTKRRPELIIIRIRHWFKGDYGVQRRGKKEFKKSWLGGGFLVDKRSVLVYCSPNSIQGGLSDLTSAFVLDS